MNERSVRYLLNAFMGMNGITDDDMEKAGYYTAERVGELQAKEADHLLGNTTSTTFDCTSNRSVTLPNATDY